MGKKALCLIFAFLLSINSFAAVVSDNDGAAFVTKAEFEAMKKDFADQITNYNGSIDSKIDGSIASYLQGINLEKRTYLINDYESLNGKARWMNLAWGSIFDGRNNLYDDTKTYRAPNFSFGDYITGYGHYYNQPTGYRVGGYQMYYNPISARNKKQSWGIPNFANRPGDQFLGFDYFGVDTDIVGRYYLENAWGLRVNQGIFLTTAYWHNGSPYFYGFRKYNYSGEPGSLIWGDWDIWPNNSEDACVSMFKHYYDRDKVDLSNVISVCDTSGTFNGVAGIPMTTNVAIQPIQWSSCYCYSPDSWDGPTSWITKQKNNCYWRPGDSWGCADSEIHSYCPTYAKVLPWHKFVTFNDIYVGPSKLQRIPAKFGEGVIVTEATSQNGELCLKLKINVDESSTTGSNVKCSAIRFYTGTTAVSGYDIYNEDKSLEYELYTDEEMRTKYTSIVHTGETEDKYKKRIGNNIDVYVKIDGEQKIKRGDYIWIKVFPYSSTAEDTICCGSKNYVTLTIDGIYQKG